MNTSLLFLQAAVAAGLGLLVGLQRERSNSGLAGIRTFPLITLAGFVCAVLAQSMGGWVVACGFLAVAGVVVAANCLRARDSTFDAGTTTEMAALLMFAVGALLVAGPLSLAVAIGAGVAVLLHFKPALHQLAGRMSDKDVKLLMQFALIALVILPALPNQNYGPFQVFNPYKTWWLVVLIVSISAVGYIALKLMGAEVGAVLGGVLGGLISSTATTASFARRAKDGHGGEGVAALVIAIASTVSLVRVVALAAFVAPSSTGLMAPPLAVVLMVMISLSLFMMLLVRRDSPRMPEPENPAELGGALFFAVLFVVITFAVAAAKTHLGTEALYVVAAVSGLTDMDAITLSTAQLVRKTSIDGTTGWRLIVIAMLANLVFKYGTAMALGTRSLVIKALPFFGVSIGAGLVVLLGWEWIARSVGW